MVVPIDFRWNAWNVEHATRHGCSIDEIETVVRNAGPAFPRRLEADKWFVEGRGTGDRLIRVIYLLSPNPTAYVIHAMPLTTRRGRKGR